MKFRFLLSLKKRFLVLKKIKNLRSIKVSEKRKVKPVVIYAAIILAVILPTIYILNNRPKESAAAWFDDGWSYRQRVPITNAGSAQTDYQVSITVDTAALVTAGKLQSDCDDIRMVGEDGKILSYWIEENNPGCNQTTTKIWVKIPSIPTTGSNIYMYYGNSSASVSSDGRLVFPMFDDFADNTIDDWVQDGIRGDADNDIVVSSGKIKGGTASDWNGFRKVYPQVTLGAFSLDVRYNVVSDANFNHIQTHLMAGEATADRDGYDFYELEAQSQYNVSRYDDNVSGAALISADPITVATGWHTFALRRNDSNSIAFYQDSTLEGSATDSTYTTFGIISFNIYNTNNEVDYFFLRKYATTEPAVGTLASEEKVPSPLGYWKFDEGSGTTVYSSGNDNGSSGTLGVGTSEPQWQTSDECISGSCMAFDGTHDYVDTGEDYSWAQTDSFSFSFWINAKATQNATIFGKGLTSASSWEYSMRMSNNIPLFVYWNTGGTGAIVVSSSQAITLNNWHHLAVTYNGSTALMYMDGKVVGTQTGVTGTFQNRANNLRIGSAYYNGGVAGYFPGLVDEVKVYNYARSAAEIKADFTKGAANKGSNAVLGSQDQEFLSEGLVGYWKIDENTGTTTSDSSGNAYTGTLGVGSSAPTWTGIGKYGSTLDFDGTNDYISLGTPSNLVLSGTEFTLSSWIYLDATGASQIILAGQGDANDKDYRFWVNSSNVIEFDYEVGNAGEQDTTSATTLSSGSWYHVAVVYKNDASYTVQIYINGRLDAATMHTYGVGSQNQTKVIGQYTNANYFNGKIDELRVYRRAFTRNEISQLYEWTPGPVLYHKLDENTGTTSKDSSENGFDSDTFLGNTIWSPGKYGSGLEFDGNGDYVTVPDDSKLQLPANMTIMTWVKVDTLPSDWIRLVGKGATTNRNYGLWIATDGDMLWQVANAGGVSTCNSFPNGGAGSAANIAANSGWQHFAATYDGANLRMYKNGILVDTTACTLTPANTTDNVTFAYAGFHTYLDGGLDEAKIYNYVRSQKQIIQDMNAGHPAVGTPVGSPILDLKMDEGYGTTLNNSGIGGTGANGTLGVGNSAPTWTNSGKFGKGISFDGVNDIVAVSDSPQFTMSAYTLSLWINPTSLPSTGKVYQLINQWGGGGAGNASWTIDLLETGLIRLGNHDGTSTCTLSGTTAIPTSEWSHVQGVYTGGTAGTNAFIYINGLQDKSGTLTCSTQNSSYRVLMGLPQVSGGTTASYSGVMDEVKVYAYALSPEEVMLENNGGKSIIFGSASTTSAGVADNSSSREFCVPGDSSTCNAPISEWRFDENTGTSAYDTSTNSNTGTLGVGSSAPVWAVGKVGSGLYFDGDGDYVNTANELSFSSATSFSVSGWAYTTTIAAGEDYILDRTTGSNELIDVYRSASSLIFRIRGDDNLGITSATATSALTANEWFHFTAVRDVSADLMTLYIDGVSAATATDGTSGTISPVLKIGNHSNIANAWAGGIDQIRVYNYARTPAQVAWEYNRGAPIAHYKMDECEGTTIYNSAPTYNGSPAGNNGTLTIGATGTNTAAGSCTTSGAWAGGATGRYSSSLNFDGTDDRFTFTTTGALYTSAGTVSVWVNLDGSQPNPAFAFSQPAAATNSRVYMFWNGGTTVTTTLGATTIGTYAMTAGQWYNVVLTWDGTAGRMYVNGMDTTTTGTFGGQTSFVTPTIVGCQNSSGTQCFDGRIDDVKTFNYALTPTQIKTLYTTGASSFE